MRIVGEGWPLVVPSSSLPLVLPAFGMGETFVRPETGGVGGRRKIRKKMLLKWARKMENILHGVNSMSKSLKSRTYGVV